MPRFHEKRPLFAPIAGAASRFDDCEEWPSLFAMNERLAPLRFVIDVKKTGRRARKRAATGPLYDARIQHEGVIPTRERSWHDFFNACVWATFPNAKQALSARQLAFKEAALAKHSRLPNARSRDEDRLTMLDEGGVLLVRDEKPIVFGHAIYEHFVSTSDPVRAKALDFGDIPMASLDAALAERLEAGTLSECEAGSVVLDEVTW
jgi:hypothetical protein